MTKRRVHSFLLIALAAVILPCFALAADLNIDIGKSVFGLPPDARQADIRKLFGEPAATITMNQQRHGLLYGTNILLIFDRDRLWQARTWFVQPWSPQLYHGWLQYVPPTTTRSGDAVSGFTVNGQLKLGAKRDAMEKLLGKALLDADEFSAVANFADTEVWLGYAYPDESNPQRTMSTQTVVSLVVEFKSNSSSAP